MFHSVLEESLQLLSSAGKVIVTIFCGSKGLLLIDYLLVNTIINRQYYAVVEAV